MAKNETDAEAGHINEVPPPTYTQTENEPPPPSYASIYGELKAAQLRSDGKGSFLKNVCTILGGTLAFTVLLAISMALPIAMIVIGALNLNYCPIQHFIPIWLIVGGSVGALMQLISLGKRAKKRCEAESEEDDSKMYNGSCSILGCFNLAWFITGNVWVYSIYKPETNSAVASYCDFTTYYMAFGLITAVYVCLLFVCCCSCCIAMCAGGGESKSDN